MTEEIVDAIVYFIFGIGVLITCLILYGLGYLNGEDNLI